MQYLSDIFYSDPTLAFFYSIRLHHQQQTHFLLQTKNYLSGKEVCNLPTFEVNFHGGSPLNDLHNFVKTFMFKRKETSNDIMPRMAENGL